MSVPKNRRLVEDVDTKSLKGIFIEISKSGHKPYLILKSGQRSLLKSGQRSLLKGDVSKNNIYP
jgi:hypothetical protein